MTKRKNTRSMDEIANDIHALDRGNIFDKGDLLLEAKAQCEHGDWLDWVNSEFDWSVDTARRCMRAASLSSKYRKLRHLGLTASSIELLADQEDGEMPAIIKELTKHATGKRLSTRDAARVIEVGIGRHRHGDHPDATLYWLVRCGAVLVADDDKPLRERTVAALLERKPTTDEAAEAIIQELAKKLDDEIEQNSDQEEAEQESDQEEAEQDDYEEAEAIIAGTPPKPPPPTPAKSQKLHSDTTWAETAPFLDAMRKMLGIYTKPIERFVGHFTPTEHRKLADFHLAIAAAEEKAPADTRLAS